MSEVHNIEIISLKIDLPSTNHFRGYTLFWIGLLFSLFGSKIDQFVVIFNNNLLSD
jgi:hypothetical protein